MFDKPTVTGNYPHIYSADPCLDTKSKQFDHEQWKITGEDKYLPRKNGNNPVVFKLKHLSGRAKAIAAGLCAGALKDESLAPLALYDLVSLSLVELENATVNDGEAVNVRLTHDPKRGVMVVNEETMAQLSSIMELIPELGTRIIQETFGNPLSSRE